MCSSANEHDSTKFIDVMENISEFVDDSMMDEIVTVYADKGYDAKYIRNYLKCNGMNLLYSLQEKFQIHCIRKPEQHLQ